MQFFKPQCPICGRRNQVHRNTNVTAGALVKSKKWFCYRDGLYFNKK